MKRTKKIKIKGTILALDPGTKFGWASSRTRYGLIDLTRRRDESVGIALLRFEKLFEELIELTDPALIVYEKPGGRNYAGLVNHSKLVGEVEKYCERHNLSYVGFSASEIKRHATGKGNCGKPAMIEAAQKKLGYIGEDDNEADALWMRELAAKLYKV